MSPVASSNHIKFYVSHAPNTKGVDLKVKCLPLNNHAALRKPILRQYLLKETEVKN
jgi:hypothetical protein